MLERATAGLESCRFQRILAGSGRSFSSCRRLHSALWRHAAAASSHPPPLTCPRAACARLRRPPPAALPPPDSTRRCFTSSARVAAPPPEAPEPSSEAAKTDPARPGTAAGGTPRPVDTIEYVDDSSLFASQLTELLSHPDQERYEDAWDLYCRLEPSQREPVVEFVALYLSRSDRVDDARRIVSLLKTIPSESWSEQLQSVFIRAAIRSGQVDLALARFQTGLEQGRLSGGLEYILVDLLLHHRWPTLLKVWADHMRCRGPESPGETLLDSAQYLHFQTLPDMGKLYLLFERYLEGEGSGPAQAVNFYPDSRRGLAELRRVLAAAALSRPCPLREAAAILEIQADGQLYESYILHQLDRWRRGLETKSALAILQDLFRMYRALPGAAPSVDLLHGMLDLCSPNNVAAVEDLYRDWHAFHVEPDQAGYEKFLDFYAGAGDTDAVKLLWARYAARFPEAVRQPAGFWAVVKAYASAGDVEGAQGELQRMRDQYGVEPDLAIWNSMLKCYMRAEEPTRMLETFDEVRKTHQPDSTTYGIVMALAAKRGDLDAVHKLFEQAQNEEVAVGGEMSVALVTAYCQNDRLVAAENLCKELSVRKEASLTAWNQLLYFTGAHHKLAKCHELLQTIKKHGFEWDAETYRALLNAFVKVGQLQPAWRLLRSAVNDKLFPVGVEHFEVVMFGAVMVRDVNVVQPAVALMQKAQLPMTLSTQLACLTEAFRANPNAPRTRAMAKDLIPLFRALVPTRQPAAAAAAADGSGGSGGTAVGEPPTLVRRDVVYLRKRSSHVPRAVTLLAEMRDFDSAEALVELYSELFPRYKQRPFPPLLTASLMQAYLNDGRWERVMQLWERLWEEALATLRPPGQGAVAYPGYRHYMSKPFPYLAKALQAAGRGADLARWVDRLVGAGFTLTRDGWNGVIQALVVAGKWERGMSWCENKLMAGWRGWRPAPARLEEKRELKNPRVLMPNKQTMQDLLRQWLQMRKLAAWSSDVSNRLKQVEEKHPVLHHTFITADPRRLTAVWVAPLRQSLNEAIREMLAPLNYTELKAMEGVLERELRLRRRTKRDSPFHVVTGGDRDAVRTRALDPDQLRLLDQALRERMGHDDVRAAAEAAAEAALKAEEGDSAAGGEAEAERFPWEQRRGRD